MDQTGRARGAVKLVLAALPLAAFGCGGGTAPARGDWGDPVWSDEFDGATAGQSPDPTKWGYDIGTGWGNQQQEFDTDRPSNVSLDGQGNLAIVARRESYSGSAYTSARITTKGRFAQQYGKFEARIKLPIGPGLWPAFWLLGANNDTASWPLCGEIDIMEGRGQEPLLNHGSLHGPGYSGGNAVTRTAPLADTGFHVYSVEWSKDEINFLIDGVVYEIVKASNLPSGTSWVFDHPFFIILNVAVGGNYVGSPSAATQFPQTMLVDYVRVYQRAP